MTFRSKLLPVLACASMATAAQATTVQVVLDVGNLVQYTTPVAGGFSLTLGFDLEQPDSWGFLSHDTSDYPYLVTSFRNSVLTPSPSTAMAEALIPAEKSQLLYIQRSDNPPPPPGIGSYEILDFRKTGKTVSIDGEVATTRGYSSFLVLQRDAPFASFEDFHNPGADAFVAMLQELAATGAMGRYTQSVWETRYKVVDVNGVPMASTDIADKLGGSSTDIQGRFTIRSVSLVPEPGTLVLTLLGLGAVAAVARRRASAG